MKGKALIIGSIILFSISGYGASLRVEGKVAYFIKTDKAFRDIYGTGTIYGGEINIGILKYLELWAGGRYYRKKGELAVTKEMTEITLFPLEFGLKLRDRSGGGYIGIGIRSYQYKETNPIGEVKGNSLGILGQLGLLLKITNGFMLDIYLSYSHCEVKPQNIKVNIGGGEVGIGLGFEI